MPEALSIGRAFSHCYHLRLSLKVVQLHPYTEPAHLQTELLLFSPHPAGHKEFLIQA